MSKLADADRLELGSRRDWAEWLGRSHATSTGVWLRLDDRRAPGPEALSYENAVLEALCWGWIDGQTMTDGTASFIWFCPRRPTSVWAASNKARLARLLDEGRMQAPGLAAVELARANGSWSVLDGPEAGVEPSELTRALDAGPGARQYWDTLPPSARKYALTQIALAKRESTRVSRAERIARRCAAGERPDR